MLTLVNKLFAKDKSKHQLENLKNIIEVFKIVDTSRLITIILRVNQI